jgi:hypothetical protein
LVGRKRLAERSGSSIGGWTKALYTAHWYQNIILITFLPLFGVQNPEQLDTGNNMREDSVVEAATF